MGLRSRGGGGTGFLVSVTVMRNCQAEEKNHLMGVLKDHRATRDASRAGIATIRVLLRDGKGGMSGAVSSSGGGGQNSLKGCVMMTTELIQLSAW